jgi:hypothetical protein
MQGAGSSPKGDDIFESSRRDARSVAEMVLEVLL